MAQAVKYEVLVEYRKKGETQLNARLFASETEAQTFIQPHRNEVIYGVEWPWLEEPKVLEVDLKLGDWDWFVQRIVATPV